MDRCSHWYVFVQSLQSFLQCQFSVFSLYTQFLHCPVLCLRAGREELVKAMVKTLWFFVPGNSPWNKVTTWKADGNLRFQDLALYKLVRLVQC
jgi:hypothetical protein